MTLIKKEQHKQTRSLWEEIFSEDSKEFLDYYYTYMADHNQIFAQQLDGEYVSMIHLNPYQVSLGGNEVFADYIVAVATRECHRHQGRMKALLQECFREMYQKGNPFTFLMPASEAIYEPFQFVTVYHQTAITVSEALDYAGTSLRCTEFLPEQIDALISFSNQMLKKRTGTYTVRDRAYYERILKEQESMNGKILCFYKEKELAGYCFSGCEEGVEIWELAVEEGMEAAAVNALLERFADQKSIHISGFFPGRVPKGLNYTERPLTMVRIIHLEKLVHALCAEEKLEWNVQISDPYIKENNGAFCIQIDQTGGRLSKITPSEQLQEMKIEELAGILFEKTVCAPVFFNEIV